ncbi:ATP phosphoribosyltransferase [Poriferisphaera corsica]|uniref:ATP phosphoribosyltransferase n=1 Tax=Poriferisphaera corsica TaxID=2528020 RepID=A0A517YRU0_9BACT|nr:ATP phosphoribosyltransferase [Poriferisphaera corsica]QDU32940.1 ATP phosphoribosyltransferase [Poriferisphaera corsica]
MSENQDKMLKIGIPKGSLQDATVDLFARAGYGVRVPSRSYIPEIDDDQISGVLFRAQEMSRYVEDGVVDMGITGHDWVIENNSDVVEVCELKYSKATSKPARWVLAVAEESGIDKVEDLEGKIIATELPETTKRFFAEKGVNAKVEFSWGATEVKARLVDGIVDVTETGSSLRANKLKVLAELLSSTTRLIANKDAWNNPWKRQKIEDLALLLQGAIAAKSKVGLKMNVEKTNLDAVLQLLPSEQSPTVNQLADNAWVAIEVIVDIKIEREIVPQLMRAGAKAIFSYPLNKVIP